MKYYLFVFDESIQEFYLHGVFNSLEGVPNDLLEYCTYKIICGELVKSGKYSEVE